MIWIVYSKANLIYVTLKNLKFKNGQTALHEAAFWGCTDIFQMIIEMVVDKNPRRRDNGWTPLHYAAKFGRSKIVETILAVSMDKNPKDFEVWYFNVWNFETKVWVKK